MHSSFETERHRSDSPFSGEYRQEDTLSQEVKGPFLVVLTLHVINTQKHTPKGDYENIPFTLGNPVLLSVCSHARVGKRAEVWIYLRDIGATDRRS